MDASWFNILTTSVSRSGTRRRLVAALPLAGAVGVLLGEEAAQGKGNGAGVGGGGGRRRRRRSHHHPGQDRTHRSGKRKRACAKAGQTPRKGKRKGCCNGLTMAASGRCAVPAPSPDPVVCTGPKSTDPGPTQGLQEAIDQAGATLTLCAGTWNLTESVVIAKGLTLIGAGAGKTVLDGGDAVQVLVINQGATVALQDLTITKGNAESGGGISNHGTLALRGVSVTGNTAPNHGGGIYSDGNLTLQSGSHVTGNTTEFEAAGGAGIYNYFGTLTLEDGSSVTGNSSAYHAGGIYNDEGTLTLEDGSSVTGNIAGHDGGGIYNNYGTMTVDSGAIICSNVPLDNQCAGDTFSGACPAPSQTCPS